MTRPTRILPAAGAAVLAALIALAAPAEAQRAAGGPPDWPCVQRLVPELAWGTIWTGPSLDELDAAWHSDPEIGRTVRRATAREIGEEEAVETVRGYAESVEEEREEKLTLLFAGLFELISRERSQTIDAILRYSRGQVGRLERVGEIVDQLEEARRDPDTDPEEIARLEQELHWERRVFEDRQASLRALCLQPYLLEERLSRLVRAIQAEL
jgi:hypothetical protein